jgi:hypothetical protein
MAEVPDMEKLEEQIKALKKRSDALDVDVDETHQAAESAKAEAAAQSKELSSIKERKK